MQVNLGRPASGKIWKTSFRENLTGDRVYSWSWQKNPEKICSLFAHPQPHHSPGEEMHPVISRGDSRDLLHGKEIIFLCVLFHLVLPQEGSQTGLPWETNTLKAKCEGNVISSIAWTKVECTQNKIYIYINKSTMSAKCVRKMCLQN